VGIWHRSVEALGVIELSDPYWAGRRVFVTGHTGFKGSWLSLWLQELGAEVCGYALEPCTSPALFVEARVAAGMVSHMGDIRDLANLRKVMTGFAPEIVIHMAAQPLVRASYDDPVLTYETNIMGTVNVLEAIRACPSVRSVVNVTTDKCYENREWVWGYRENEAMGGFDPYSSSKGCAELVTAAYRQSFFSGASVAVASARAGNVIGGGDWALDRLVPDILKAFQASAEVDIRNPGSVRPWQHVLEPLSGYLLLARRLEEKGHAFAEGWNFGPAEADAQCVSWIADRLVALWDGPVRWRKSHGGTHAVHEANYLRLDCSKARVLLGWEPRWSLDVALARIIEWHRSWMQGDDARAACIRDIAAFHSAASSTG
jgi:CDP-glucose 4,6-dehydratase